MNSKDVIYIDVEDDITAIIDRVKAAKADIVALVPPKRVGILQSIVNLKLLKRAATTSKKRIVLISSDAALASLAAGVKIPTAKNLQSRPEIAPVPAPNAAEAEVIDGSDLPVGEVSDALSDKKMPSVAPASADKPTDKPPVNKAVPLKKSGKSLLKVPDFLSFRKKLFIIGGIAVLLLAFLWWAFWVAPTATVAVTARTEVVNIEEGITLDPAAAQSDPAKNLLKPVAQQLKKSNSIEFTATGKKEVGEKAKGTVVLQNCESPSAVTVPAGTAISANGLNFITASAATVPGGSASRPFGPCDSPGRASVAVSAQEIGEQYNLPSGTTFAVAGRQDTFTARTADGIAGGSKRQITVVSQSDVDQAKQKIATQSDAEAKAALVKQFSKGYSVVQESFSVTVGEPAVNPAVDAEATKSTITVETTYTMLATNDKDMEDFLRTVANKAITNKEEKSVYETGRPDVQLSDYKPLEAGRATTTLKTVAYIGAKINQDDLKKQMEGKRYGEIESLVNQIPNIEKVDISFSPFWVNAAPSADKITLEFNVKKNE